MGKVDLEKLKELMLIAKHGSNDKWGYREENKNDLAGEFVFVFDLDGLNARGIHVYRFAAAAMNAIPDLCEELKSSLDKIAKLEKFAAAAREVLASDGFHYLGELRDALKELGEK